MVIPLSHTASGDQGRIVWIASDPRQKHRLMNQGFLPEETVTCEWKLPKGLLCFYRVGGTTIALRRKTANEIFVELLKKSGLPH